MIENKNEGLTITAPIAVWATALTGLALPVDENFSLTKVSDKFVISDCKKLIDNIVSILPPKEYDFETLRTAAVQVVADQQPAFAALMRALGAVALVHFQGSSPIGTKVYEAFIHQLNEAYPHGVSLEFKS